ncbi:hypothetical protein OAN21_01985 [Alphaproteobacteria bacterium]|nr:hypothetical protein [Alphaproteobacteria bacterium]
MTQLKIEGAGMPPLLLEGVTQTLEALPLGGMHRAVNGDLLYTGDRGQVKYRMACAGTGPATTGLDGLHRGDVVTVHCLQRLWQEVSKRTVFLSRPPVLGTVLALDANHQSVDFEAKEDQSLRLKEALGGGVLYVSYCPILKIRLMETTLNTTDWGAEQGWRLVGEEV